MDKIEFILEQLQKSTFRSRFILSQKEKVYIEEIIDVMEVIDTLLDIHGWTFEDVKKVRKEKAQNRGGFKDKIYLESIENGRENECHATFGPKENSL